MATRTIAISRAMSAILFHHMQHIEDDETLLEIFFDERQDGLADSEILKARNFWKEVLIDADIAGTATVVFDTHVQTALLRELVEGNTFFVCAGSSTPEKKAAADFEHALLVMGLNAEFPKPAKTREQ